MVPIAGVGGLERQLLVGGGFVGEFAVEVGHQAMSFVDQTRTGDG